MERSSWPGWLLVAVAVAAGILIGVAAWSLATHSGPFGLGATATPQEEAIAFTPTIQPSQVVLPTPTPTMTPSVTPSATPTATPTLTPSPTPVVTAQPPLPQGFLVTVRQPVQVVKSYDASPSWWPNFPPFNLVRGRFTLVAAGTVSAGVDFARVRPENIHRKGDRVAITLPAPQLYGPASLDLSQSYVIEYPGIKGNELTQMLHAQSELTNAMDDWAVGHGLLDVARNNAATELELWLRRLGFTQVDISWEAAAAPTPAGAGE